MLSELTFAQTKIYHVTQLYILNQKPFSLQLDPIIQKKIVFLTLIETFYYSMNNREKTSLLFFSQP